MTITTFLAQFPEFAKVDAPVLQSAIDRATRWIDPLVWGTLTDDGIGALAGHMLTISPFGGNTRLVAKDGSTTYWRQYDEMRSAVAGGPVVAGGIPFLGPAPRGFGV